MLFIFDMGGVVSGNVATIPAMAKRLGLNDPDFLAFCGIDPDEPPETRYERGAIAQIQAGKMDDRTFWAEFRVRATALLGTQHPAIDRIRSVTAREDPWATAFNPTPIPDTRAVIEELKDNGHRVVCGTNTLEAHFRAHQRRGDYAGFHRVYASHQMGLIKPDHAFWKAILTQEGADPSRAAFIDDNPVNVTAAAALGLIAFRYENPGKLREDLAPWLELRSRETGS